MARPRGYINWNPTQKVFIIVDQMKELLEDNKAYLPISLRQMFYLGVSKFGWPKTEQFYKNRLGEYLNKARRSGMIKFDDIRDDGITKERATVWASKDEFYDNIRYWAQTFRLDPMLDQERDLVVWTEGKGLVPMVRKFVDKYQIEVITSGGFDGLTVKKQMADRFKDKPATVLHIGDYDPSGEAMHKALGEDIEALGGDIDLHRIAVTRMQVDDLSLPTKPPKRAGNSHAAAFDDNITVELEAIPPADLQKILETAIEGQLDMEIFNDTMIHSDRIASELMERLDP